MMKLKMLVVAAAIVALPAVGHAQTADSSAVSALPAQSVNGARPVPPSDGPSCPWGCPTSKGVAGLTGPQFLALQQELRSDVERLKGEPAIRKEALDAGLGQLGAPLVLAAR